MNKSHSVIIGASIVLGCSILGLTSGNVSLGQTAAIPGPGGRYQIIVTETSASSNSNVFIFDPTTGQSWYRSTNTAAGNWNDLGSPVIRSKK
ncbi:MAG: hypothetical protein JWN70_2993 [Planctomycetaceae bacterium]|nr:hypothetical protein [Planctomycetaceae bacterium]